MQPRSYIVYANEEMASSAAHEVINQNLVNLSNSWLTLDNGQWDKKNMNNVCPLIKEWKAESFFLGKNVFI